MDFSPDKELYPFESRWCDVNGIPIHYVDEGSGPLVLLVHGNFLWSFSYRRLIEALREDCRVIAVDLAGMGLSGKPHRLGKPEFGYTFAEHSLLLTGLLRELDVMDATLLAHDHGGAIALSAVTQARDRFRQLFICNTWAWPNHGGALTRLWSWGAPRFKRLLFKRFVQGRIGGFESSETFHDPRVLQAYTAPYPALEDFAPVIALALELRHAASFLEPLKVNLESLSIPVEIAWATSGGGPYSRLSFSEYVDPGRLLVQWRNIFPHAPVSVMDDCSYYFVTNPPDHFIERLRGFLHRSD